jgi:protein-S-isoprenylcysteine O-methyltransferase Ste14
MKRLRAALGSLIFLALAPGVVAGLVPYLLTGWDSSDPAELFVVLGAALIAAGALVLLHAFARFVMEGIGTPAPVAPTERLVVGGMYRYVRNPMYLAVGAVIAGQGLLLGRPILLAYLAAYFAVVSLFVRFYEEPALTAQYGQGYARYRETVRRWVPRARV